MTLSTKCHSLQFPLCRMQRLRWRGIGICGFAVTEIDGHCGIRESGRPRSIDRIGRRALSLVPHDPQFHEQQALIGDPYYSK